MTGCSYLFPYKNTDYFGVIVADLYLIASFVIWCLFRKLPFFRNKLVILKDLFPFSAFFRNKSSPAPDKTQAPNRGMLPERPDPSKVKLEDLLTEIQIPVE
jgi:hypothetical protein